MASKILSVIKLVGGVAKMEDVLELADAALDIAMEHSGEILATVERIEAKVDSQVLSRIKAAELALEAYLAGDLPTNRRNARIDEAISHLESVYAYSVERTDLAGGEASAWTSVMLILCYSFLGSKQLGSVDFSKSSVMYL